MDHVNDFIRVKDKDGNEHHINLANVAHISFDKKGGATIVTTAEHGGTTRYFPISDVDEVNQLRAALVRREDAFARALGSPS